MSILSLVVFIVVDDVVIGGGGAESDDGVGVGGVGGDGVSIFGICICGVSVIGTIGESCGGSIRLPGTGELASTATRTILSCFCLFAAC